MIRPAAKLKPLQLTIFSPAGFSKRPAPSFRRPHATRLVTSNAVTSSVGRMRAWMHSTYFSLSGNIRVQPNTPSSSDAGGAGAGVSGAAGAGAGAGELRLKISVPLTGPRHVVP